MFRKIIGIILNATFPVDQKFAMLDSVANPIKVHVDCFGAALFNGGVDDTSGTSVVRLDGGGRLWVTEVVQDGAQHGAIFGVEKECSKLRFCCGCQDRFHDGAIDEDWSIEGWWRCIG